MPRVDDAGGASVADLEEPVLDTADDVMVALADLRVTLLMRLLMF
jgi:hypothetical protein